MELNRNTFEKFRELIYNEAGIQMADTKIKFVESRLSRSFKGKTFSSFEELYDKIIANKRGEDFQFFLNGLSTNETYFFREGHHFDFIRANYPAKFPASFAGGYKIWCCAASTGDEPYSIALTFQKIKDLHNIDFQILATDINTEVLEKAQKGVYNTRTLEKIPKEYTKYLQKHKDPTKPVFRVKNELRNQIKFGKFNLIKDSLSSKFQLDLIFCRNVLIYFDTETKIKVVKNIISNLKKGGLLYIGHSETLVNMGLPLKQVGPTVYQKI